MKRGSGVNTLGARIDHCRSSKVNNANAMQGTNSLVTASDSIRPAIDTAF
jgi:hypothetical protein